MNGGDRPSSWQRLDRRVLAVHPLVDLTKLLPLLVVVLVSGGSNGDRWQLGLSVAAAIAVLALGMSRWFTTTYRLADDRVELRTGLLRRRHRSVHRDRIRTADLTSTPAHRIFGLAVVRVGTGSREAGDDAELVLDAIGREDAERLRTVLLGGAAAPGRPAPPLVARLHWSWARFAPLTFSALAVVGAVWVALFRVVGEFGWRPATVVRDAGQAPVWLGAVALLVTAVVGAVAVFAEGWWGYRLTRADDGGVVLRRGLLTRRTLSLEGRRIRGVEIDEPLVLRAGRGARPLALTTGLRATGQGEHVGALAPAVPRAEAHRIATETLGAPAEETTAAVLDRHPRAARTRRLVRALAPAAVLGVLVVLTSRGVGGLLPALGLAALVLAAGAALGWDRWRALGHRLTARHLVIRHGAWLRRTAVVDRAGVIGWQLSQSRTQRRTGLLTMHAITAAGRGRYVVPDVGVDRGVEIVEATTPGLLTPFRAADGDEPTAPAPVLVRR